VTTGDAVKIAGSAPGGFAGDGGPALAAFFGNPQQIAVDKNGRIYVSDYTNHRFRMLVPAPSAVTVQAGDGQAGDPGADIAMPLAVLVTSPPDVPLNDVEVQFAVTEGDAVVSADAVRTGLDGLASVSVTLGATPGPVTVTATVGALPVAAFHLTVNEPSATRHANGSARNQVHSLLGFFPKFGSN
jgi:NHL repeat